MKAISTYITVLANVSKHLPHVDLQWNKLGHYIFGALQQAFRDNVLSEIEMEFLLLTVTGFVVAAKGTISNIRFKSIKNSARYKLSLAALKQLITPYRHTVS